ncbi:hypothetical protein Anas_01634 [Armadillidium nasatum]|uniref:Transmembrane protein n=1 Tax=Armadillidium nasatum TaxID=96803 RepID=A0A5N5TMP4_9CRUS|nr:hypothetical protein Anas_01634 [Armadillidium nasatum]
MELIYKLFIDVWFFILDTWATIIFMCYTIRLLYLVRCMRCSELSRIWWYVAVVNMVVNPAQSAWWWFSDDYILAYVSIPASCLYIIFFILVCRSMTPGKFKFHKKKKQKREEEHETIELEEH